ncbi:response regulator transcription factor [Alicyclobacillus cycloheptanicus]|jgi:DNA-binding response OmpR family regulator|uniref:DNA-binding response OmpR family regulator n=1 Tax=Alicyclobacillus cycloheptanicus TaxID=1457 RepID=A0ABT9XEA6_9BACL|nr:response regulator transcription factor [Alicyclobacillus cycloheptanicus]MDQ0188637.1 DNA-binding response OmpR family regulator [Alicyclobacillus cycloheptanicus]WDM00687.1 response regulator transcription factor [Alicyclobacillus cycloheptanicus]
MDAPRILIVEDEEHLAEFIALELKHEGYAVEVATDGRDGLDKALSEEWSLLLLDIMLPEISGLEICRRVRASKDVPIIMLTARHAVPDRVAGLDAGADDYLGKPFAIEELLARIRVLLRRRGHDREEEVELFADDLTMNLATHEVKRFGQAISLTVREFSLLEMFLRNKNRVLTRDQILEKVWGYDFVGETNVVDVYVRYLRHKIDVPFGTQLIQTVRGVGYILKTADQT